MNAIPTNEALIAGMVPELGGGGGLRLSGGVMESGGAAVDGGAALPLGAGDGDGMGDGDGIGVGAGDGAEEAEILIASFWPKEQWVPNVQMK